MEEQRIIPLPKETWKGQVLPMDYTTELYYDVVVAREADGFTVKLRKTRFETPVTHTAAEYDFPDSLYQPHWEDASAFGVVKDGKLLAAIETCPESWSNRLRVTELWVAEGLRRQGLGRRLMETAKAQARSEGRRALILETQSCNVNAVDFYLHEGFTLIGFDSCCYTNRDLARKEVRLELGWFPE